MTIGTFFVRVWRIISILGFLFALFSSYMAYPDNVSVRFDEFNRSIQTVNREVLFYAIVAIFILNNTLLGVISKLFLKVPTARVPTPKPDRWTAHRPELNEIFTNWFSALSSAVNTVLAMGIFVLSSLNRGDRSLQASDYVWLLPVSMAILLIVLASLPVRLFMKPRHDD